MPEKLLLPTAAATAPPSTGAPGNPLRPNPGARRRYNSEQLFGDQTEVDIQHGEWTYRLRLTSLGKLILTK